ncbi:phosphoglucomutase [Clostridium collagenovorans DSM 3089]|uniref:Phosphoglucomutase n=1 Tax=Clostridium collagenovorans DSM 3089 TaxID=1121306 RepID=A0A1M5YDP7_9CLOT|nr:phospho-sugar mutase [Clostridium collagenovorans]SHI10191.1 phosphoglucomutase [Clostridium collagenovorans DSM 3089]
MSYIDKYDTWLSSELLDDNEKLELKNLSSEKEIEDRFYKDLEFGTGGLRGVMGIGSNRMNIYTVGKATQGLADYLNDKYKNEDISVSIAYDSRNNSRTFAERAACILCANGIKVNLFSELKPTPMLSFAVKKLKSKAGIVMTASHNPKQYNGYKVYNEYGGQITDDAAKKVIERVDSLDIFTEIKYMSYEEAIASGKLNIIDEEIEKIYVDKVRDLVIRKELVENKAKDLKIVYTPIHGSGNKPVRRVLNELGYENTFVVKEQELPDGNFPTAAYPNPEEPKVFELAIELGKKVDSDIIFGTDPDCDRIGVVVKDNNGEYKVLSGNQTGVLLTHYMLMSLSELGKLKENPVIIKTIVTTDMVETIAKEYGATVESLLTGFKYIGERIHEYEENKEKNFIFGFEESYGYLAGDFVKDKDAVVASALICEMALYYKSKGKSLYEALIDLYEKYGYYKENLISISLEGKEGQEQIKATLEFLRHSMNSSIDGVDIVKKLDYKVSKEKNVKSIEEKTIDLPASNVLKFVLEDDSWFVVRPSGTEPKMKIYTSVIGKGLEDSLNKSEKLKENIMSIIDRA